jgi:C-terminal processing protease CtpA/Prc
MKVFILLLFFIALLSGCNKDKKVSPTINIDSTMCLDQTSKNIALWGYMDDWYLWNTSLDHNTNLENFPTLTALMDSIRENNPIDRYSFIMSKADYDDTFINATNFGYGMGVKVDSVNNEFVVSLVYENSSAQDIGLNRGARIVAVNDINLHQAINDEEFEWSKFWADIDTTQEVSFTWYALDGALITQSMQPREVTTNTIFATLVFDSNVGKIGYLVYNSFIDPSAEDLNQAFAYFKNENIDELIIDLRYNHGGTSRMSNQLASQIGGDFVSGQIYNLPENNENHQSDVEMFNLNNAKHYVSMPRVVFITTEESSSGSEVLINSLKPYLDVKLVGQKTFGKPVGMLASLLCDEVVLAITHHNHNADGFGDFFNGIAVDCPANDTITTAWGDTNDPMLSEAIYLLENEQCSSQSTVNSPTLSPKFKEHLPSSYQLFEQLKQHIL